MLHGASAGTGAVDTVCLIPRRALTGVDHDESGSTRRRRAEPGGNSSRSIPAKGWRSIATDSIKHRRNAADSCTPTRSCCDYAGTVVIMSAEDRPGRHHADTIIAHNRHHADTITPSPTPAAHPSKRRPKASPYAGRTGQCRHDQLGKAVFESGESIAALYLFRI